MKRTIFILFLIFGIIGSLSVFAQGVEEEAKGQAIFEKLETKELSCEDLTGSDFEALGEYFMGQMTGASHEAMNKMMEQMMGKEGEEKMHVVIGERMSGCNPNAQMPENMMSMMGVVGGGGMMNGGTWSIGQMMTNFGIQDSWGWFSSAFMILSLILILLGIAVLIKWLAAPRK